MRVKDSSLILVDDFEDLDSSFPNLKFVYLSLFFPYYLLIVLACFFMFIGDSKKLMIRE